jgi:hypothetical protein
MPYIVTTKRPAKVDHDEERAEREHVSRRAVATLEEARDFIYSLCAETDVDDERIADDIDRLPESGGTVGPLPDGTVIEVEQGPDEEQMLRDLREWVGMHYAPMGHDDVARLWCDAYNARQA